MDPGDHRRIRALIQRELGISLGEDMSTLITSRLRHLVEKYALSSMDDYVDWLESHRDAAALGELADAISTNHTFFYRESAHFECMAQRVLPEVVERLRARNRFDLRVWCAASSASASSGGYSRSTATRSATSASVSASSYRPASVSTDARASARRCA